MDSPYKIFNPIFDPKKDDFGRVVDRFNKMQSFADNKEWEWEVEEKIPEQYWGLTFNPTSEDMLLAYNKSVKELESFNGSYDREGNEFLEDVNFYKDVIGEVVAIADNLYFIYDYKSYDISPFVGTKEEIRDHFNTIRETHDIVYHSIVSLYDYHKSQFKLKVKYAKIISQVYCA